MALKDIFTMVKADRYTADGREELNKAREADVEDRTYQIGEISQKTGLQKTANGWVKPKNGKVAGSAKKEGSEPAASKTPSPSGVEHMSATFGKSGAKVLAKEGFSKQGDKYVREVNGRKEELVEKKINSPMGEYSEVTLYVNGHKRGLPFGYVNQAQNFNKLMNHIKQQRKLFN